MRRDLITRTISGTKATVKVINPATDEISTREIQLSKVLEGAKLEKAVRKDIRRVLCSNHSIRKGRQALWYHAIRFYGTRY